MKEIFDFITHWISPDTLVQTGLVGISLIIFAESGLLIGFFLPGDSLLILAGILASAGGLSIWSLVPAVFVAAVVGDQVGYWTGTTFGRRLFNRPDSRFFKKKYVDESEEFFEKHGNKAIVLARFVPVVRTFTPILAGVGRMPYKTFLLYNIIGGVLWAIGLSVVGYLLGNIPNIDKYVHILIAVIILVSFIPVINHLRNANKKT